MNEIVGKDVTLEVFSPSAGEYIPYICCMDMAISFNVELVETTTIKSGRYRNYRPRRVDWEVTVSGVSTILGDGRTIFTTVAPANLLTQYKIRMTFTDENGNSAQFIGNVLIQTASLDGNQDKFSMWEKGLKGTGPYEHLVNGVPNTTILKLPTPTLVAIAVSPSQINLSWGAIANASGYRLYFNGINDFNSAAILATLSASQTSYSHTGLSQSSTFYYWLVAVGDGVHYTDSDPAAANATTLASGSTFTMEWGYFDSDIYPHIGTGAIYAFPNSKVVTHDAPLEVDTQTGPQGKFLAVKVPDSEPAKTTWFNTAFNNGSIPDTVFHLRLSDSFNTWINYGGFAFYITRVPYYHDPANPTILS